MTKTLSTEDRKVFCALAVAVADVLGSGQCPTALAERLLELADPLSELLTPATPYALTVVQLRALALACPDPEKTNLAAVEPRYIGSESPVEVSLKR
jgi:hypothetical protein